MNLVNSKQRGLSAIKRYGIGIPMLSMAITVTQATEPTKQTTTPSTSPMYSQTESLMKLSNTQQHLARCAALLSLGDQQRLAISIQAALEDGIPINTLKDSFVQLYAYTGFPRSLNALATLMKVVNERKQAGKNDIEGEATPIPPQIENAQQDGEKVQTELVGQKVAGALFDFAPAANYYLQSHLFGDIFSSPVLDWQNREIVTVSALAALAGVESQLKAHVDISRYNHISNAALAELVTILENIDTESATRLQTILTR